MAEYIAQQLWGFIHQSIKKEDLSPPSSSPSPQPPSSSLEENGPVSAYATLSPSPSPILPVRMIEKGKQWEEETPLTPPGETSTPLPCLICWSLEHALRDCPEFPQIHMVIQDTNWLCILCKEQGHGLKECPNYRCPICLPCPWTWEQLLPKLSGWSWLFWWRSLEYPRKITPNILKGYSIRCFKSWNRGNVIVQMDPYPFSSIHSPAHNPQTSPQGRTAWSHARSRHKMIHSSFLSLAITLSQLSSRTEPKI